VRVWGLESIAAAVSKADGDVEDGVVGIVESVRVENKSIAFKVVKELYLDGIPLEIENPLSVEWVGFDDEKVLVLTSDDERDKNVTMYDFTV